VTRVACQGCGSLVWANGPHVRGYCAPCMEKIEAARPKPARSMTAREWFYGQSFNGGDRAALR